MKNEKFYNHLAPIYDTMISFDNSLVKRAEFFRKLLSDYPIITAADLGCGSGVDAVALAQLGIHVTAFDPSGEMLRLAKQRVKAHNRRVSFLKKTIAAIPAKFNVTFDAAFAFGNTFANISPAELEVSIAKIHSLLKPDGLLIFQLINYAPRKREKDRVVAFKDAGEEAMIRFYEVSSEALTFHFLQVNKKKVSESIHLKTILYPHTPQFMNKILAKHGFTLLHTFGGITFEPYDKNDSKDFVAVVKKTSL